MSDEIKEILDYFRKYMTIDDCIRLNKIEDYITNLQQENDRLNNIINELEKWAKSIQLTVYRSDDMPVYQHQDVLDKLKELKENNNAKD